MNNAALLYVLAEIKCELCSIELRSRKGRSPCGGCEFHAVWEHYKKLAESEL